MMRGAVVKSTDKGFRLDSGRIELDMSCEKALIDKPQSERSAGRS